MAVFWFPSDVGPPSTLRFGLVANTQTSPPSPWTGAVQTLEMPGARWAATLTWTELDEEEWRRLASFVAALGGQAGRFRWWPPGHPRRATRQPAGAGGITVAALSYGRVIVTRGWDVAPGAVGQASFRAGDLLGFEVNGRPQLHMAVEDTAPAPDGTNAMLISPPLRRPVPVGTVVNIVAPVGLFRLTSDSNPADLSGSAVRANISISIEEAIFG